MTWTRKRNPLGPRDSDRPLVTAAFENEAKDRITVAIFADQYYSPKALQPGIRITHTFKEKGKPLISSEDDFLAWPLELLPTLVELIQEAGTALSQMPPPEPTGAYMVWYREPGGEWVSNGRYSPQTKTGIEAILEIKRREPGREWKAEPYEEPPRRNRR